MSDRMNKERAKHILENESDNLFNEIEHYEIGGVNVAKETREYLQALDIAIESLDNEWVDVRDRLPSESGWYLVTYIFDEATQQKEVSIWEYNTNKKEWLDAGGYHSNDIIIAWKPLPQPYVRKE